MVRNGVVMKQNEDSEIVKSIWELAGCGRMMGEVAREGSEVPEGLR